MAIIQLPRNKTALEAMGESVSDLVNTITQLKFMKGQRLVNEAAQNAIAQGGGLPEVTNAVNAVKTGTQNKGIFGQLIGTFDPRQPLFTGNTDTENLISQLGIRNALAPQGQQYTAAPWYTAPQWRDTDEGRAAAKKMMDSSAVKDEPLNILDINRDAEAMDETIKTAKDSKWWWRKDFTKENLKSAWDQYKSVRNFDSLPSTQKQQLINLWNNKLANKMKESEGFFDDSEYDWDPNMLNMDSTGSPQAEISNLKSQSTGTNATMLSAPDTALDPYWKDLNDEEKKSVLQYLQSGGDVNVILKRLK